MLTTSPAPTPVLTSPALRAGVAAHLLIVPQTHLALADNSYQGALFRLFHSTPLARLGHALCTPVILTCGLALTARGGAVYAGLLAAAVGGYYVLAWRRLALLLGPLLAALCLVAGTLEQRGVPTEILLAGLLGAATLQALSHVLEPIPPPWSGGDHFASFADFLARASLVRILSFGALAPWFVLLEIVAAVRSAPVQVLGGLAALGRAQGAWHQMGVRARAMQEYPWLMRLP